MTGLNALARTIDDERLPCAPATPFPRLRRVAFAGNALIAVFFLGFGYWASAAPLESAAIAAGAIEAESNRKTIQHLEGGIVREILVRDGDMVETGQALIRLDNTRARTEVHVLQGQMWDARAREARLIAERGERDRIAFAPELVEAGSRDAAIAAILAGQEAIFDSRRRMLLSQLAVVNERSSQVDQEIAGLRAQGSAAGKRAEIIREEIATVQTLVDKGLTPRPRLLALQREMVEIDGRRGETAAQISRAHQVVAEAKANLLKLRSEWHNDVTQALHETQNLMLQLAERMQAAADRLARTVIAAPEAGTITDLRVRTPGGVIGPGASLMDVIPRDDRLVIDARLRPEDVDVVRTGQAAEIHLTAYKQRRAPPLAGIVTYVSADRLVDARTNMPYYAMRVRVDDEELERASGVELVPGMPVQVFVKTGESTVALYALGPLLDSLNRAFRED